MRLYKVSQPSSLAGRPRTKLACQQILRFIHRQEIAVGQRLPAGRELGKELGICANTLHSAMEVLATHGIVDRKQKRGTILQRRGPDPHGPKLFVIAVVAESSVGTSSSAYVLFQSLRQELQQRGCEDRTYLFNPPAVRKERYPITDFPSLKADIDAGQIDAVISPRWIEQDLPVPICQLHGNISGTRWGIDFDRTFMIRQALPLLTRIGCLRPAVAFTAGHAPDHYHLDRQQARRAMAQAGCPPTEDNLLVVGSVDPQTASMILQRFFYDRPRGKRVDGLIVTDDHLAQRLAEQLRHAACPPQLVVQTNKQIPFGFALPAIRFDIDIEEYARKTVRLLVRRLLDPTVPSQVQRVWAHLCTDDLPPQVLDRLGGQKGLDAWRQTHQETEHAAQTPAEDQVRGQEYFFSHKGG